MPLCVKSRRRPGNDGQKRCLGSAGRSRINSLAESNNFDGESGKFGGLSASAKQGGFESLEGSFPIVPVVENGQQLIKLSDGMAHEGSFIDEHYS